MPYLNNVTSSTSISISMEGAKEKERKGERGGRRVRCVGLETGEIGGGERATKTVNIVYPCVSDERTGEERSTGPG